MILSWPVSCVTEGDDRCRVSPIRHSASSGGEGGGPVRDQATAVSGYCIQVKIGLYAVEVSARTARTTTFVPDAMFIAFTHLPHSGR